MRCGHGPPAKPVVGLTASLVVALLADGTASLCMTQIGWVKTRCAIAETEQAGKERCGRYSAGEVGMLRQLTGWEQVQAGRDADRAGPAIAPTALS